MAHEVHRKVDRNAQDDGSCAYRDDRDLLGKQGGDAHAKKSTKEHRDNDDQRDALAAEDIISESQ